MDRLAAGGYRMTPTGTRVTWFGLGWCVGVATAFLFLVATPSEAPEPPSTAPALRGAPQELRTSVKPVRETGAPILPAAASEETQPTGAPVSAPAPLSALYSGTATWCAPTPKYCQSWGGDAMLGAVNSFRWGDEPYRVRVRHEGRSAVVTVVSFCACRNRADAIDLSPAAFSRLAELPLGRIPVEVEVLR